MKQGIHYSQESNYSHKPSTRTPRTNESNARTCTHAQRYTHEQRHTRAQNAQIMEAKI